MMLLQVAVMRLEPAALVLTEMALRAKKIKQAIFQGFLVAC
jgi:hypothetical protein